METQNTNTMASFRWVKACIYFSIICWCAGVCFLFTRCTAYAQSPTPVSEYANITIHFYNREDTATSTPYMNITFRTVHKSHEHEIESLQKMLNADIERRGGIREDEDYAMLAEILPTYAPQCIMFDVQQIEIAFPRKNAGAIFYWDKP